jgi:hypothetical protein
MARQKRRQTRYRYITNGTAVGTDPIKDFRLVGVTSKLEKYHGATALRVRIPHDLALTKYSCDSYSTTRDPRTLDELGYDFLVWDQPTNQWVIRNEFKGMPQYDVSLGMTRASLKKKKAEAVS